MKRILIACDPSHMDGALRRSLAHLITSCEISVVHNGYAAFDEIGAKPFDLIVIDFQISGIDSLELVESLQYIDPGVPVILMLQESHKSIRDEGLRLRAQTILTPFKPLKFLRLVDKLLHQQLNRYRQLAGTLEATLAGLCQETGTPSVFLVEDSGQILMAYGQIEGELLGQLGNLAVGVSMLDEELERLFAQDESMRTHYQEQKDHGLYVIPVIVNLRLALLSPLAGQLQAAEQIWTLMDKAATATQTALVRYNQQDVAESEILRDHVFIPLSLDVGREFSPELVTPKETFESVEEQELAVNWGILSNNSNVLSRLQNFIRTDN
jgi:DNA-binding NarL/FixJ family response regulator